MKFSYIFLIAISILMYNVALAKRDQNMFEAYDKACADLPKGHPDCIFAKTK